MKINTEQRTKKNCSVTQITQIKTAKRQRSTAQRGVRARVCVVLFFRFSILYFAFFISLFVCFVYQIHAVDYYSKRNKFKDACRYVTVTAICLVLFSEKFLVYGFGVFVCVGLLFLVCVFFLFLFFRVLPIFLYVCPMLSFGMNWFKFYYFRHNSQQLWVTWCWFLRFVCVSVCIPLLLLLFIMN